MEKEFRDKPDWIKKSEERYKFRSPPTKEQLREIFSHLDDIGIRTFALIMKDSGARFGELINTKFNELNLDADPPYIEISSVRMMRGKGRRAYFTDEAKETIEDYLMKVGQLEPNSRLFVFTDTTARNHWNKALKKAGIDHRVEDTQHRVYSFHSLRMFYRYQLTLAGMPDMCIVALMGFSSYLNKLDKVSEEVLASKYREYRGALEIFKK